MIQRRPPAKTDLLLQQNISCDLRVNTESLGFIKRPVIARRVGNPFAKTEFLNGKLFHATIPVFPPNIEFVNQRVEIGGGYCQLSLVEPFLSTKHNSFSFHERAHCRVRFSIRFILGKNKRSCRAH